MRRIVLEMTVEEALAIKDGANCLWFSQNDPAILLDYVDGGAHAERNAELASNVADRIDRLINRPRSADVEAALKDSTA